MSLIIPSYKTGFARRAAEAEYPNLWKGLVGSWCPHLGPSGLTLYDHGANRYNGTLVNMVPSSDWLMTEKGWALDFDGSDDRVDCSLPSKVLATDRMSVSAWVRPTAYGSVVDPYLHVPVSTGDDSRHNGWSLEMGKYNEWGDLDKIGFTFWGGAWKTVNGSTSMPLNTWHHMCATYDLQTLRAYLNNKEEDTLATTAAIVDGTELAIGCMPQSDQDKRHWQGQIGPVHIWNRALAPSEIQQLYVDPYALHRLRVPVFPAAAAAAGAIMNQMQNANLGADLFDGALSV